MPLAGMKYNRPAYRKALDARLQPLTNDSLNARCPLYIFYSESSLSSRYNLYFLRRVHGARKIRRSVFSAAAETRETVRHAALCLPLSNESISPASLVIGESRSKEISCQTVSINLEKLSACRVWLMRLMKSSEIII